MSLLSTIGIAKTGTNSLRTTVPEGISVFLGVQPGDKLEWRMQVMGEERVAVVKKGGGIVRSTSRLQARKLQGGKL